MRAWCRKGRNRYLALWKNLTGWKLFLLYTVHYTLLFALVSHYVFLPFEEAGKSLIWTTDGMSQHFSRLSYISQTFRNGIQALLNGEGWTIPLYDFRTGLVAQDLQIGFPQLLAVFCPWDQIDRFYQVYVVSNYYLMGLSFSAFGFFWKQKPLAVLIGAISYSFCGYSLYAGVQNPHFVVPMIFLPLLIMGTERVLRKERAYLLLVTVFLSLTTQWGLYFSCMQAIFVALYVFVRFPVVYPKNRWNEFVRLLGRLCVWGGIGVLLAAFVAVPSLMSVLGIERIGHDISAYTNFLAYSKDYYEEFLTYFTLVPTLIGSSWNYWTYLAFPVLTIPAIVLLFVRRKKDEQSLRILFGILTVMLMIPAVAYVMSGFSNVTNRFLFGYSFCTAAILMFMAPHFVTISRNEASVVGIVIVSYFVICRFFIEKEFYSPVPFVMLGAVLALALCCFAAGEKGRRYLLPVCLLITCCSVCHTAFLRYDPTEGNYVKEFTQDPYATIKAGQYASLDKSETVKTDESFFRVAGNGMTRSVSTYSFYYDLNGVSMYPYSGWSSEYVNWVKELELPWGAHCKQVLLGLYTRAPMLTLAGVKYYADRETGTSVRPYGFQEIDRITNGKNVDAILRNEYDLPLGYTYEGYLSRETYDALNPLGKQEAQLQAVVLEKPPKLSSIAEAEVTATARQVPYGVAETQGVSWSSGVLKVTKENGTITLRFRGLPQTETYLRIVNLDLNNGASTRRWVLTAKTAQTEASTCFAADAYVYANGQKTQTLDMGYTEDGFTEITVTFPKKGTFILHDFEVWCQPMDDYARQVHALQEEVLENIETNWRGLTGTISVSTDKMLCIALPYMNGWKAYVDGQEVELYQANTAFMAVELPAGAHTVEFRYWLPGLTVGLALSGIGAVCLAALLIARRKKAAR